MRDDLTKQNNQLVQNVASMAHDLLTKSFESSGKQQLNRCRLARISPAFKQKSERGTYVGWNSVFFWILRWTN